MYKAAAEIGELGDNTAAMRARSPATICCGWRCRATAAEVSVLGHTRWASVGIISEPNAHPVNSDELEQPGGEPTPPYVVGVLNGDVDNHADLKAAHGLRIAGPITTDAKVIPALVARHAPVTGDDRRRLVEAFRRTVARFEGSVAIGAAAADEPEPLLLALRGSGQGVYVGLADDRYVVASEPYGVVEETDRYVRLDGEHGGQLVALDARARRHARRHPPPRLRRLAERRSPRPTSSIAEVTTRDIDRGDAPHFLLKEITESPDSFAKTLRGKIVDDDGQLRAVVGDRALPADVAARLPPARSRGSGSSARARPPSPGESMAMTLDELRRRRRSTSTRSPPPSCPASGCGST